MSKQSTSKPYDTMKLLILITLASLLSIQAIAKGGHSHKGHKVSNHNKITIGSPKLYTVK